MHVTSKCFLALVVVFTGLAELAVAGSAFRFSTSSLEEEDPFRDPFRVDVELGRGREPFELVGSYKSLKEARIAWREAQKAAIRKAFQKSGGLVTQSALETLKDHIHDAWRGLGAEVQSGDFGSAINTEKVIRADEQLAKERVLFGHRTHLRIRCQVVIRQKGDQVVFEAWVLPANQIAQYLNELAFRIDEIRAQKKHFDELRGDDKKIIVNKGFIASMDSKDHIDYLRLLGAFLRAFTSEQGLVRRDVDLEEEPFSLADDLSSLSRYTRKARRLYYSTLRAFLLSSMQHIGANDIVDFAGTIERSYIPSARGFVQIRHPNKDRVDTFESVASLLTDRAERILANREKNSWRTRSYRELARASKSNP